MPSLPKGASQPSAPVTVITPVRNGRATLPALFRSLREQRLHADQLRWIVVDDGSTDDTVEWLLGAAAELDCVVTVLTTEGGLGAGPARNLGLEAVESGWLTFADADDAFEPGALEAWRVTAERLDVDVLITDPAGQVGRRLLPRLGDRDRRLGPAELWRGEALRPWSSWGKLYRRQVLGVDVRFPAVSEAQDLGFFVAAVLAAEHIGYAPGVPRYVYTGPSRALVDAPLSAALDVLELYRSVLCRLRELAPDSARLARGSSPILGGVAVTLIRGLRTTPGRWEAREVQRAARAAFREVALTARAIHATYRRDRLICGVGLACATTPLPIAKALAGVWVLAKRGADRIVPTWSEPETSTST